ncbi:MAG: hypothetical protein PHZ26_05150 [Candidatus Gracilibacteria bacterium]|nr:hypothetical protein [Candidatus Gracilibacteria bacterium]MDD2909105.1 hypothetical protein [Candidatus Gracilibacteria bacterium]
MKNKFYYTLGGFMIVAMASILFFKEDFTEIVTKTQANPDYICIKNVTTGCTIESCTPWSNKQRTCIGKSVTQVAYYSVRIGCAEGGVGTVVGSAGGASGRRTADFTYNSVSCSIVQTDNTPPTGEPDVINQ